MVKYRKKPVIIEATQWFKNGDHPEDNCIKLPDAPLGQSHILTEGKIVRYYRTPDLDGQNRCKYCDNIMHNHGWIETVQGDHVVCPGDYVITETGDIKKGFYPCKPDIFDKTYDKEESMEYSEKLMELRRLNSDLIFLKNLQESFCLDDNRIQEELKLWVSTKENDMIICINEMSGFQIKK